MFQNLSLNPDYNFLVETNLCTTKEHITRKDAVFIKAEKDWPSTCIVIALNMLCDKQIETLTLNKYTFDRKSFEMKNGRFNWSKALYISAWAYHSDIMHELLN